MDWKAVGGQIAKYAPALGAAIGGPVGGAVGGLVSVVGRAFGLGDNPSPDAVSQALAVSPDAAVKLAQIEADHKDKILAALIAMRQADSADLSEVNQTIRADEAGQSWLQRNHHALECLSIVYLIIALYVILPLLGVPVPTVPESVFIMLAAMEGVTAWGKGQANVAAIKADAGA